MPNSASRSSAQGKSNDWSFNFRANPYYERSDSESDSGADGNNSVQKNIVDLNGIDLSAREETVSYKPNPFSIAKINAACRANIQAKGAVSDANVTAPASSRPKAAAPRGQQTMKAGFQKQASKTRQPDSSNSMKSLKSSLGNAPSIRDAPGSLVNSAPTTLKVSSVEYSNSKDSRSTVEPADANPKSCTNVSDTAHISTQIEPDLTNADYVLGNVDWPISASLPEEDDYHCHPIIGNARPDRSSLFPHIARSAPYVPGRDTAYQPHATPVRPSTVAFKAYHSANKALKASQSSPLRPISNAIPTPFRTPNALASYAPAPSERPAVPIKDILTSFLPPQSQIKRPIALQPSRSNRKSFTPATIPNTIDRTNRTKVFAIPVKKEEIKEEEEYSFKLDPIPCGDVLPTDDRMPFSWDQPLSSPISHVQSLSGRALQRFGYAASPHKNAVRKETSVISGRRIQMYIPPPPPSNNKQAILKNAQGNALAASLTREQNEGRPSSPEFELTKDATSSDPVTFEEDTYPSPNLKRTRSSNLASREIRTPINNISITLQYSDTLAAPAYRPISPPTSDIPIPVDDAEPDVHLKVDVQAIRRNYPARRASLRKRRRLSDEMWEILGLESCGVVHKNSDHEHCEEDNEAEIGIICWFGSSS
ncbi:hypothetical protein CPB84DRAFT_1822099 [Gymnopilus junonius]|uniref:Uncharacterized protein n=1 Tax=Gymnopilus junonius TaxID=109634 RepID=A0A9P5TSY4_GYMJU|nr:hypothetical protein CPB84DRAFT_1822099 [Gymnopilus junonius]